MIRASKFAAAAAAVSTCLLLGAAPGGQALMAGLLSVQAHTGVHATAARRSAVACRTTRSAARKSERRRRLSALARRRGALADRGVRATSRRRRSWDASGCGRADSKRIAVRERFAPRTRASSSPTAATRTDPSDVTAASGGDSAPLTGVALEGSLESGGGIEGGVDSAAGASAGTGEDPPARSEPGGAGSGSGSSEGGAGSSGGSGASGGGAGSGGGSGSSEGGSSSGTGGGSDSSGSGGGAGAGSERAEPFRFFSPSSFWNVEPPTDAPLDPNSAAIVGALEEEVSAAEESKEHAPNINTTNWSVPVYTVPAGQPVVKVTLEEASESPALQAAWDEVPLPANAEPAAGTDKHLVVWQPSTDKLWEFWHLEKTASGWRAVWGGAMEKTSEDSGAYGPEAWAGAKTGWGASASSLSIAGGLITLEDLEKGAIDHALALAVPDTRAGVYATPAERTDGSDSAPTSLPEGAHLRLEPGLDLAALHLPRLTLMLAEAAQRYGIFVRDTAANIAFYAQTPPPGATDPYPGAHGFFEGKSAQTLLAAFPWSHLQLLKMELHDAS
jgi:hypothetical protein